MSDLVTSVVRDIIQKIFGVAFAYFAVHGFNINQATVDKVDNWAVLAIIAGLLALWTALVRALEERKGTSTFDQWCRIVGRFLMLGVSRTPSYPTSPPPPPTETVLTEPVPDPATGG